MAINDKGEILTGIDREAAREFGAEVIRQDPPPEALAYLRATSELSSTIVSEATVSGWLESMPPKCPGCRQPEGGFHLADCAEPDFVKAREGAAYHPKITEDPIWRRAEEQRRALGPPPPISVWPRGFGDGPDMHDPHRRAMYPDPYPREYRYREGELVGSLERGPNGEEIYRPINPDTKLILEKLDRIADRVGHSNELLSVIAGLLQAQAERDPLTIMEQILEGADVDLGASGGPPGS